MTAPAPAHDLSAAIAVTRFGLGARPGEIEAAQSDPRGWVAAQIRPSGADQPDGDLPDSRAALAALRGYRVDIRDAKLAVSGSSASDARVAELKARRAADLTPLKIKIGEEMLARTRLAALTPASFRERWTLFWSNHFTVSAVKLKSAVEAGPFEREAIRPHVFGRFEDLLVASTTHPGMLLYLDQETSIGPDSPAAAYKRDTGLNENLGREVLELHTVGADAGYTQADVTEFARALTGYTLANAAAAPEAQGRFQFNPAFHEPGPRTVMGRRYGGDGPEAARAVLHNLAVHPATAGRLSRKLAAHFTADDPPPALVGRLARVWRTHDGDLAAVARALVESPEAWSPQAAKFKTPNEFLVSAYRAAGTAPERIADVVPPLSSLGQRPLSAPQPNGWSDSADDWATGAGLVRRMAWAQAFTAAHAPGDSPVALADAALGARAGPALRTALARAETRPETFALLLMSPEFQRR